MPVDVLLQRIGRLHRHPRRDRPRGYEKRACVVLAPDGADLSPLLTRRPDANGLGPQGFVYTDRDTLADVKRCDGRFGGFPFKASGSLPRRGQLLDTRFRRTRATFAEELTR